MYVTVTCLFVCQEPENKLDEDPSTEQLAHEIHGEPEKLHDPESQDEPDQDRETQEEAEKLHRDPQTQEELDGDPEIDRGDIGEPEIQVESELQSGGSTDARIDEGSEMRNENAVNAEIYGESEKCGDNKVVGVSADVSDVMSGFGWIVDEPVLVSGKALSKDDEIMAMDYCDPGPNNVELVATKDYNNDDGDGVHKAKDSYDSASRVDDECMAADDSQIVAKDSATDDQIVANDLASDDQIIASDYPESMSDNAEHVVKDHKPVSKEDETTSGDNDKPVSGDSNECSGSKDDITDYTELAEPNPAMTDDVTECTWSKEPSLQRDESVGECRTDNGRSDEMQLNERDVETLLNAQNVDTDVKNTPDDEHILPGNSADLDSGLPLNQQCGFDADFELLEQGFDMDIERNFADPASRPQSNEQDCDSAEPPAECDVDIRHSAEPVGFVNELPSNQQDSSVAGFDTTEMSLARLEPAGQGFDMDIKLPEHGFVHDMDTGIEHVRLSGDAADLGSGPPLNLEHFDSAVPDVYQEGSGVAKDYHEPGRPLSTLGGSRPPLYEDHSDVAEPGVEAEHSSEPSVKLAGQLLNQENFHTETNTPDVGGVGRPALNQGVDEGHSGEPDVQLTAPQLNQDDIGTEMNMDFGSRRPPLNQNVETGLSGKPSVEVTEPQLREEETIKPDSAESQLPIATAGTSERLPVAAAGASDQLPITTVSTGDRSRSRDQGLPRDRETHHHDYRHSGYADSYYDDYSHYDNRGRYTSGSHGNWYHGYDSEQQQHYGGCDRLYRDDGGRHSGYYQHHQRDDWHGSRNHPQ